METFLTVAVRTHRTRENKVFSLAKDKYVIGGELEVGRDELTEYARQMLIST
jgi:hypothetical protein